MDVHVMIEEALGAWAGTRQGVISEIENIPEDNLDVKVGDGARTAREIARHILEAGYVFGREVALANGGFNRAPFRDIATQHLADVAPTPTRDELLAALRGSMDQIQADLRATGPTHLIGSMRGLFHDTSRISMIHFASSHEYYHCGQLTMCARAAGIMPAMTQKYSSKA